MKCPQCGSGNGAHAAVTAEGVSMGASPEPGDVSVCAYCRTLGVFTDDGSIRPATDGERVAFLLSDIDEQIRRAVQIARLFNSTFGRGK